MLLSYLCTLFKLSGSQAFPSGNPISYKNEIISGWSKTFVAPSDGFICVSGNGYCKQALVSSFQSNIKSYVFSTENGYASVFVPIRKGHGWNYFVSCQSVDDVKVCFTPSVGSV